MTLMIALISHLFETLEKLTFVLSNTASAGGPWDAVHRLLNPNQCLIAWYLMYIHP